MSPVLRDENLFRLQLANRIAQLRRRFELEAFGGFAHVGFEFGDVGVEFVLGLELGDAVGGEPQELTTDPPAPVGEGGRTRGGAGRTDSLTLAASR